MVVMAVFIKTHYDIKNWNITYNVQNTLFGKLRVTYTSVWCDFLQQNDDMLTNVITVLLTSVSQCDVKTTNEPKHHLDVDYRDQ